MPGICAIILAAGESKRMGSPKMLLDFGGYTMIETVIRNVRASSVDDIIVVLGAYRDEIQKIVDKTGTKSCYNDRYKDGMLSSVQCGFRNIPEGTIAVMVFQGDQPFITSGVSDAVISEFKKAGKGIIMPVYNGKRGHPLLISRKYFDEVGKLDHQRGLRSLSDIFSEDVEEVSVKEAGILRDFDTFDQYKKVINQI